MAAVCDMLLCGIEMISVLPVVFYGIDINTTLHNVPNVATHFDK